MRISASEAQQALVEEGFTSAVGHQPTAEALSVLLGVPVQVNRIPIQLRIGDMAVVASFAPGVRLPEGKVLSREEVEALGLQFWHIRVTL